MVQLQIDQCHWEPCVCPGKRFLHAMIGIPSTDEIKKKNKTPTNRVKWLF